LINFKNKIVIHATNVAGLGAREVSSSILHSLANDPYFNDYLIQLRLPNIKFWHENAPKMDNWEVVYFYRSTIPLIRFFIRVFNLFFGHLFLPKSEIVLVLGDFPLRIKSRQVVLLHNPHIVPENSHLKKFDKFIFQRLLFKINHKFINSCIVQTDIIKNRLINKLPNLADKVFVLPMPVSDLFKYEEFDNLDETDEFKLFFPSSFYAHKNHSLISKLNENSNFNFKITFILTIDEHLFKSLGHTSTTNNVKIHLTGQLDKFQVLEKYSYSDALFFPSFDESYGLPLVEAMKLGKIIICSDKPFARWLCGEEAIYFDPNDYESAENAIILAHGKRNSGWKPNWADSLSKIPENWDAYFFEFQKYLK
jgi:glycosyltransferase involved in cell wall biosynthesis